MIKSLHLKNFKCFENQCFELSNLTLLTGLNGTGKSSVIQSLLLLRQSYQQRFLQDRRLLLNGDLLQLGTIDDVVFEGAELEHDKFGFGLDLSNGNETVEWHFQYQSEMDVAELTSNPSISNEVYDTSFFSDNFHYLPAERIGPQSGFEVSDYSVRERGQLGVQSEYAPYFLHTFRTKSVNSILVHSDSRSANLIDQVEAWMGEISPGVGIQLENFPGIDRVDLRYTFRTEESTSGPFRSTNVGFGITYTLPIVLALLASGKDTLVLIENPEAHLHPVGQIKLGELMARAASCGIQVIVETHSDHIIEGMFRATKKNIIDLSLIRSYHLSRDKGAISSTVKSFGNLKQLSRQFRHQAD